MKSYKGKKCIMKKIIVTILITIFCLSFVGCATEEEKLNADIDRLNSKITQLENTVSELEKTRDSLKNEIIDIKVENGTAKYVLTLNIKQVHYSLDLTEYLKDSMNDVSIEIPVDKEYYDSVDIGDTIDDSFRLGSAIFKGSFGSWEITVEDKEIQ